MDYSLEIFWKIIEPLTKGHAQPKPNVGRNQYTEY
jgi:hypothetical protein